MLDRDASTPSAFPSREERRRLLTIYGRKAVLEALGDERLDCRTLHLASSNRRDRAIAELEELAAQRQVPCRLHTREELARISRNGRQDQGVALDVFCPAMRDLATYLAALPADTAPQRLLALDGVTNPQNMGMALRSAAAAGVSGVLYADRGNPALGPLVIKASAGALFRAPLLRCASIAAAATELIGHGFTLYRLQAGARNTLWDTDFAPRALFVLGGETHGISDAVQALPGEDLAIPMANGVESLNVAVSAALLCYAARYFDR
jgi:23S rRNA (guanosine2251-2'-O)-methyltransferase